MEQKTMIGIVIAIVAILIVAAAAVMLMNNGNNDNNKPDDKPTDDYYPITVDVKVGDTTYKQTFKERPSRIVTVWDQSAELMCYFGLEKSVVKAYAGSDYITVNPGLQKTFNALDKDDPSTELSVEKVVDLNPDLIVGWSSTFGDKYIGSVDSWNKRGTNCFVCNRPSASVEDYTNMLATVGKIFNMTDKANALINQFTSAYKDVEKKTAGMADTNRVKAMVIEPGYNDGCFVYGSEFLTGDLVTVAGGYNLYRGSMEMLTKEKIASYSPEVVFLMGNDSSTGNATNVYKEFTEDPAYATLVENCRDIVVYRFSELYDGGMLPNDIVERMYKVMYESENSDENYYPVTVQTTVNGVTYNQTFTERPKNVLTIYDSNAELMCYFGLQDLVKIAYVNGARADGGYICMNPELQPLYDAIPKGNTQTDMQVEKVVAYEPDLILSWVSSFRDTSLGTVDKWNDRGINCYATNRPSDSVEDYTNMLMNIGIIFNKVNLAKQKIAEFTAAYEDVKKATANLPENKKPTALVIEPGYDDGCFTYGKTFLTGDLVTVAGGNNLYDGAMTKIGFETLDSYVADVVILMSKGNPTQEALTKCIADFQAEPKLASLAANAKIIAAYGFYEIYDGGILPYDIIDRIYNVFYGDCEGTVHVKNADIELGSVTEIVTGDPNRETAAADGRLWIVGNANLDDVLDSKDIAWIKKIIRGQANEVILNPGLSSHSVNTRMADANQDGVIDKKDIEKVQSMIDATADSAKQVIYYVDVDGGMSKMHFPAKSIISTYEQISKQLQTLHAMDQVIACDNGSAGHIYAQKWLTPEKVIFNSWNERSDPSAEVIEKYAPDIVITGSRDTYPTTCEKLLPANRTNMDIIRISSWEDGNTIVGTLTLGFMILKNQEALEYAKWADKWMGTISEKTKDLADKVKVLSPRGEYDGWQYIMNGPRGGKYETTLLAGADNIITRNLTSTSTNVTVTPEWVKSQSDCDFIIPIVYGDLDNQEKYGFTNKSFYDTAVQYWSDMTKAYGTQVHVVDNLVSQGTSYVIGAVYMAKWFYPELFADMNPDEIFQEFMDKFLQYDFNVAAYQANGGIAI